MIKTTSDLQQQAVCTMEHAAIQEAHCVLNIHLYMAR